MAETGTIFDGIWSEDYHGDRWIYAATRETPKCLNVPQARVVDEDGVGETPFGTLTYPRPLTPAECERHGLRFICQLDALDDLGNDCTLPREVARADDPGEPFSQMEKDVLGAAVDAGLLTPAEVRQIRRLSTDGRYEQVRMVLELMSASMVEMALAQYKAPQMAGARR